MVQHEPTGSHSTARTSLARALDCRRWLPGPCQSRGMGTRSRPRVIGMWGRYGVEVTLLAGDGQRYERGCEVAQLLEPVEQGLFGQPRGHSWRAQFAPAVSAPRRDPATEQIGRVRS
jgi:hypothetical protein